MDPTASGVVANLSSEGSKCCLKWVKRHMCYVIKYKKYVEKFEQKHRMLMAKRTSIEQEVDVADRNGEKIKADVQLWLQTVDKEIEEEEKIKKVKVLQDKAKSKCFIGLCPNFISRHQLSRKAEKVGTAFAELIQQAQFNGSVGYRDVPPQATMEMDTHEDEPPKNFESFKSREKVFKDVLEALKDAAISMIGVYGMAGVGKTSLVKQVARQAQEAKLFDTVVTVMVTQTPDIHNIQDHVAEILGLKLEEKSTVVRASRLFERLKEKKVLVVLDDIWAKMNLTEVGIPFGNQHKGVKILMTSRDQNVLSNAMEAEKTFGVDALDDEEAWKLFKKKAGDDVESAELRPTAVEVAKRCARLPLAVSTVAMALRNKKLFAWKDALRQLQRPSPQHFTGGITAEVYSAIKLSYYHLESEEIKQIFMLCGLFRRNSIEMLLRYAIGLGLINGVNTVEEARDRLLTMVSNLKASCLLLDSNFGDSYFDMHDVIYDVAISIASEDNHILALGMEDALKDWPDEEIMKKCNKIFFECPIISELPSELNCPQLVIFVMYSKDPSLEIPTSNFFRQTINLRVLGLINMKFSSLPSSISLLTSLRTLCLDLCALGEIAVVKELKNLEILSLKGSDIRIMPEEIGQLVKLKVLDLNHCTKIKIIPRGLLPNLSRLEELYMGHTCIQWAVGEQANQGSNASLAELNTLSSLTTLQVHILDANAIPRDLFFERLQKLERYKIFIGREWEWFGKNEYSRTLKLSLSRSLDHLDHGINMLLKKTENLYLGELKGVKIAMQNLKDDQESLAHLKNLHIQNGLEIKYIIDGNDFSDNKSEFLQLRSLTLEGLPQLVSFCSEEESGTTSISQHALSLFNEKVLFPCLESLLLSSINVERIWRNQLSHVSVCTHENLSMLTIERCNNLMHLLPISMARKLVHLKYFEIVGCQSLREIIFAEEIEEEEKNADQILFPQLNSLKIRDLQHLIAFWSENHHNVEFPSLKLLNIENCPEMKGFIYTCTEGNPSFSPQALFDEKVSFPSLEEMRISNLRNMKIIWQIQVPDHSFRRLRRLDVKGCDALMTILSSNMLRTIFQSLQSLSVHNCASLEQVFEFGSEDLTSQLTELSLDELPYLKYIWKNDSQAQGVFRFENLRVVDVCNCLKLKNIFPSSIAKALPQLKQLKIASCRVEEIVSKDDDHHEELGTTSTAIFEFDQLSSLKLFNLQELKCFYPGLHTTKWPMLKRLYFYSCGKMKIFGTENRLSGQFQDSPSLFLAEKVIPKLEKLSLERDDIAMISDSQILRALFHQIKVLRVVSYRGESDIFPISFLERFCNLQKLEVVFCRFKELFPPSEGDHKHETYARTVPSTIRRLKLSGVDNLKYVWKEDVRVDQILPNLETLKVSTCHHLISLGSSEASFRNLTTLHVSNCNAMMNLVPSSAIVQSLAHQLKTLEIRDCASMKEIVGKERDENEATIEIIIFSKLKSLQLRDLPKLQSFCSGDHTFEFPSLEEVILEKCPHLEVLCKGVLRAPNLEGVKVTDDDNHRGHWSDDHNSTVQQLYAEKVGYQGVQNLVLSELPESIEIWRENFQGVVDFKNIKYLEVFGCNSFKYIFTVSMVVELVQCLEIKVKYCPMMEQIISNEEAKTGTIIMLPRLWRVVIDSCSNLTTFCEAASITVECPSLQHLSVIDCPKIFALGSTFGGGENEKSFFNDEVICPNLWWLTLSSTNIQNLLPAQLQVVTYSNVLNLKSLLVSGCHNLKHLFPSCLIKDFVHLEELVIDNCKNMEEVVYRNGLEEAEGITQTLLFPELKTLVLKQLPKLERFCHAEISETNTLALFNGKVAFPKLNKLQIEDMGNWNWEEIWEGEVFNDLRKLRVSACGKLKNLLPSSVSLKALTTLQVSECHGLTSLVTLTTAKTMVLLTVMIITDCQMLEEIIASTSEEVTGGIIFSQLKYLELSYLPSLSRFCAGNYAFQFPSLEEEINTVCPNMEIFSKGENVGSWHIIQFFIEKIYPGWVDSELSYSINIQKMWHDKLLATSSFAQNLTCLTMEGYHDLNCLFSSSMVESFVQLKRFSVENCENVEKVVFMEGLAEEQKMRKKLFRKLEFLSLKVLPKLTTFFHGNYFEIEFPLLRIVRIECCPTLKTFFISRAEGNNSEIASTTLFNEKVGFPCLEDVSIIA